MWIRYLEYPKDSNLFPSHLSPPEVCPAWFYYVKPDEWGSTTSTLNCFSWSVVWKCSCIEGFEKKGLAQIHSTTERNAVERLGFVTSCSLSVFWVEEACEAKRFMGKWCWCFKRLEALIIKVLFSVRILQKPEFAGEIDAAALGKLLPNDLLAPLEEQFLSKQQVTWAAAASFRS